MFQRIRDEKPEVLKKLVAFQGDVTFDGKSWRIRGLNEMILWQEHTHQWQELILNVTNCSEMSHTNSKVKGKVMK